jgi:hypothetical protein
VPDVRNDDYQLPLCNAVSRSGDDVSMTNWCPPHLGTEPGTCTLDHLLREAVTKFGEVLIRHRDLPIGQTADTSYADSMIDLQRDLEPDEWHDVLAAELQSLARGPEEPAEPLAVVIPFPDDGTRLRELRRASAAPPPVEGVIPSPRHALPDDLRPRSSSWVVDRARRYDRIHH